MATKRNMSTPVKNSEDYIPDTEPQTIWWQEEADVWEGKPGERTKWIGRFDLKAVRQAIRDGRLRT